MELLIGFFFIILFVSSLVATRRIESPYVLVSGIWGLFLIMFSIFGHNFMPLGYRFYISIVLWVSMFYLGSLFGIQFTNKSHCGNVPDPYITKSYYIITPIFAIISSYLSIRQAWGSSNPFLYLRMMSTGLDESIQGPDKGVFVYLTSLILILFLIELATNGLKRRKIVIMLFFFNILLAFISMAKSIIFTTMVSAIIVLLLRKEISFKLLALSLFLIFGLFIGMQTIRSQESEVGISFFESYFYANAVAFEHVEFSNDSPFGAYVFRLIYAIGHGFGLTAAPVDTIMQYTVVGHNRVTNTYTVLYPFFHDFGYLGVAIFGLFLGLIAGYFYKKSRYSIPAKVMYSILGATILFQLFGEILMTNASLYIQYLFYAYLPYKVKIAHGRNFDGHL